MAVVELLDRPPVVETVKGKIKQVAAKKTKKTAKIEKKEEIKS
jgi:hypothetical protein